MVKVLATEEDIHEIEKKFYNSDLWKSHAIWNWPTKVEFDCDEEKMLSEIARYTGFRRDFIAREAVRYFYQEWYLKQPRESGPYYRCHDAWFGVVDPKEGEDI